jgi:hypothetical protein
MTPIASLFPPYCGDWINDLRQFPRRFMASSHSRHQFYELAFRADPADSAGARASRRAANVACMASRSARSCQDVECVSGSRRSFVMQIARRRNSASLPIKRDRRQAGPHDLFLVRHFLIRACLRQLLPMDRRSSRQRTVLARQGRIRAYLFTDAMPTQFLRILILFTLLRATLPSVSTLAGASTCFRSCGHVSS